MAGIVQDLSSATNTALVLTAMTFREWGSAHGHTTQLKTDTQ